ncbi:uncharacterized protein K460DRAFT_371510 [Cucurbitaria berberidis CBS 394.84]|uniref:Uncharacterized protein n=1 Tax=Cucurbitaria berberidis CBS 394.84 TaxID=1168544 RepID=A0A9P4L3H0_9PLEO|nr:uncharacterized protein K460DRAFT_371510 [Cucurbitaria berberidis CBS 394.84]KAF1840304.1 hypothetical protein K460DRAFT_371510 [Cucurbitaria berberidis CBS 394.84]
MNLEEEMETLIDIRLELEDKAKVADESSDDENDEEEEEEDDDDDEEDSEPIARPAKRWRRN